MSNEYYKELESMEFECDFGGCTMNDTFDGQFMECVDDAKEAGWLSVKKEDWFHLCPEHANMIG